MERVLDVIHICLPVFAVIALGKILQRRGFMRESDREYILKLVYWFSLPSLLLSALAKQDVAQLGDPGFLVGSTVPILLTAALFAILAKALGYRAGFAAAFIISSFWANVAYLGFPFARNAFGEPGFLAAAQYNSIGMILMITLGYTVIGLYTGGENGGGLLGILRRALLNPFILSSLAGILISLAVKLARTPDGGTLIPGWLSAVATLGDSVLKMVGSMGLPLALVALGGALRWQAFRGSLLPVTLAVAAKMILVPLITYAIFRWGFPGTARHVSGVVVMLSGMPTAIVAYVISRQIGVDDAVVGGIVVASTVLVTLTIPVWVYLVI